MSILLYPQREKFLIFYNKKMKPLNFDNLAHYKKLIEVIEQGVQIDIRRTVRRKEGTEMESEFCFDYCFIYGEKTYKTYYKYAENEVEKMIQNLIKHCLKVIKENK